jgi:hypothetical protein
VYKYLAWFGKLQTENSNKRAYFEHEDDTFNTLLLQFASMQSNQVSLD